MPDIGVAALIRGLADEDTFIPWSFNDAGDGPDVSEDYAGELEAARARTGHDEAVVVGECQINGRRMALIISDFDFLAGSVGRRACQLLVGAFARAQAASLPVFASPASGGTRMQEGTPAFVLMADVAAAVARFRESGGPLIVWLRNPTTGGVMATWGSLGTITLGQPGALAGFLGPRVFGMLRGTTFPAGVQTTDNLAAKGIIDETVELEHLRPYLTRALSVLHPLHRLDRPDRPDPLLPEAGPIGGKAPFDAWQGVLKTRRPERPGVQEVLAAGSDATRLSGTGEGERSDAVVLAIARFAGQPCIVVGQDRAAQAAGAGLNPAALRTARRGFRLAAQLRLPLVTVIDTAGAELSPEAEEAALAGEIARCLAEMTMLPSPTVSVLLGMGCGGGALALMPADRVVAAEHAWLSPLPLEGASIIRYRNPGHAPRMANEQNISAVALKERGIVDVVIDEQPDAADEPAEFARRVVQIVGRQLRDLTHMEPCARLRDRQLRLSGDL